LKCKHQYDENATYQVGSRYGIIGWYIVWINHIKHLICVLFYMLEMNVLCLHDFRLILALKKEN
jgi:hypothetical protein